MAKYKQLTHEQRKQIESGLQQQDSFKKIAETIGKDCSTISKEVRSHLIYRKTGAYGKPFNDCSHFEDVSPIGQDAGLSFQKPPKTAISFIIYPSNHRFWGCSFVLNSNILYL